VSAGKAKNPGVRLLGSDARCEGAPNIKINITHKSRRLTMPNVQQLGALLLEEILDSDTSNNKEGLKHQKKKCKGREFNAKTVYSLCALSEAS
jgi:hypothetical protein